MEARVGLIAALIWACFFDVSHANPVITSVQGHLADNTRLIITGSGFGNGPKVELFDPFEDGLSGTTIPLSNPRFGFWSGVSGSPPIFDTQALSGFGSFRVFDSNLKRARQFVKVFAAPATEVFVSFWVRVPPGTFFPGATDAAVFPVLPSWELALLSDGPNGIDGDDDLALPLFSGFDEFRVAGTDFDPGFILGSAWWSWTEWMRLSFWLKADSANPSGANGIMTFQSLTESDGIFTAASIGTPLFDADDNAVDNSTFQWTQITMPGFINAPIASTNVRPVTDDIYIASGPNSQARVEIGNNVDYFNSTNLSIATPVEWSNDRIVVTLNQGSFSSGATAFVHVVDANGRVTVEGFPLTRGTASADDTASGADETTVEGGCFLSAIQ